MQVVLVVDGTDVLEEDDEELVETEEVVDEELDVLETVLLELELVDETLLVLLTEELLDEVTVDELLVVMTVDEAEEELDEDVVLVTVAMEEEDEDPPFWQGWLDSRSVATYRFKAFRPPQVSVLSPVQGMLQEEDEIGRVPLPKTTPQ